MKQVLVVAALFVATLAISLWALGVFEGPRDDGDANGPGRTTPPNATPGAFPVAEPKDEPKAEMPLIEDPVRVLGIVQAPRSFTQWLFMFWDRVDGISYQVWATEKGEGIPQPVLQKALPAIVAPPTAEDLAQANVLLLDDVNPARFPPEFWARVAERVKAGTLGLLVMPGVVNGLRMSEEPSLASVLPAQAAPVAPPARGGGEIAGVYREERPFAVTDEGRLHPASRLTSWKEWSGRIWELLSSGPTKWGTKFCHPVASVKPDAKVLLDVRLGGDRTEHALIASEASGGRVLWVGFYDVGDAAIRAKGEDVQRGRSFHAIRSLSASWIAWLAKRI